MSTTTIVKPTFAEAYQAAADRLKSRVCKLLQWDDMQYAEYQYKTGIAYLHWYLPCDDYGRNELERSKLFWNWFKMQWGEHDYAFLEQEGIKNISPSICFGMYAHLHCPRAMAKEIKPNSVVLAEIKAKVSDIKMSLQEIDILLDKCNGNDL